MRVAGRKIARRRLGQRDEAETQVGDLGRFERGASRPSGDTLKRLSDALDVTSDYLLEVAADDAARAKLADRELLQQFQAVERLPDEDKHVIKTLLDAFLTKRHMQTLVR